MTPTTTFFFNASFGRLKAMAGQLASLAPDEHDLADSWWFVAEKTLSHEDYRALLRMVATLKEGR